MAYSARAYSSSSQEGGSLPGSSNSDGDLHGPLPEISHIG